MKWYSRRAAAVVLAAALFVPLTAAAPSHDRDRDRYKTDRVARIITIVKRLFGVSTNGDVLSPPTPAPTPPPPSTTT